MVEMLSPRQWHDQTSILKRSLKLHLKNELEGDKSGCKGTSQEAIAVMMIIYTTMGAGDTMNTTNLRYLGISNELGKKVVLHFIHEILSCSI